MCHYKFPLTLICIALAGCNSSTTDQTESEVDYEYGTKTAYSVQQDLQTYEIAPDGYRAVYTQMLARHGSRVLSSRKYDDLSMQVWELAEADGALTELGKTLGPEIQRMMAANEKLGYGNLSSLGIQEHDDLAQRLAARHSDLWDTAVLNDLKVVFEDSGKDRAIDSGTTFSDSFKSALPEVAPLVNESVTNKPHLYFHKEDANDYYQDYINNDPELLGKINELMELPRTKEVVTSVLSRIYTPEFIDRLAAGEFELENINEDGEPGGTFVRNDVDAALMLYNLFIITSGMKHEAGDTPWKFKDFITQAESSWLAYVDDGNTFYEKGPSFDDTDITYRMANILVDDFFDEVENVGNNTNTNIAKLRFAHAEAVMPFAAALQLEGSEHAVSSDSLYSRSDNDWRGAWVSPLTANIQWDVYSDTANTVLVTMFYNEKQINFKSDCVSYADSNYYYEINELKRCFDR
ncbi:histidine-type phosphatase [Vibrio sp. E150_011]